MPAEINVKMKNLKNYSQFKTLVNLFFCVHKLQTKHDSAKTPEHLLQHKHDPVASANMWLKQKKTLPESFQFVAVVYGETHS